VPEESGPPLSEAPSEFLHAFRLVELMVDDEQVIKQSHRYDDAVHRFSKLDDPERAMASEGPTTVEDDLSRVLKSNPTLLGLPTAAWPGP
jgi:hypothetical protein